MVDDDYMPKLQQLRDIQIQDLIPCPSQDLLLAMWNTDRQRFIRIQQRLDYISDYLVDLAKQNAELRAEVKRLRGAS